MKRGYMQRSLMVADSAVSYQTKEAAILVVGLAWVLMIGSGVIAGIILCGWKGAKSVAVDWFHLKATFVCR
jgi:hypothetical protein